MRLMSRRRYSMKRGEDQRDEPHASTISGPGAMRRGIGGQQHLEAQHRVERDVEQQAGQHRRDRRRAFGMRVGQPGVQRREADLGAVAEQQEDEGDVEQRRIECAACAISIVQTMASSAFADHRPRRHIDEDGAEQRQRDADAAEDEIFPGRLERLVRAVDADHQHGGQRRQLRSPPTSGRYCWRPAPGSWRTSGSGTSRDRSADRSASAGRSRAHGRCSWR